MEEPTMGKQDKKLMESVADELSRDPEVDAAAIAVSADSGMVTLRGTVGTFREKCEAERDARRVGGGQIVVDELCVRPFHSDQVHRDAGLRGDVLRALAGNSLVPDTIDADVQDERVRLTGTADWRCQCTEATSVALRIVGVTEVLDEIALNPKPNMADVRGAIDQAFQRSAKDDADRLAITIAKEKVTLQGMVGSQAEHDCALAAAWSAPGVTEVEDRITVEL